MEISARGPGHNTSVCGVRMREGGRGGEAEREREVQGKGGGRRERERESEVDT